MVESTIGELVSIIRECFLTLASYHPSNMMEIQEKN